MRGLRDKIKRTATLAFLKKQRADIIVLVETHVEGRLQLALHRPWIGWTFHSTHTSHARGVSILVAKSLQFEICDIITDLQGKYIFMHVKIYGEPFLLLAFYVPSPFSATIIVEGLIYMSRYPNVQTIWLGDFNETLNPNLDRLRPSDSQMSAPQDTRFFRILTNFHLIDTWKYLNPQVKKYSCFSSTHNSMSRIDLILLSQSLLPQHLAQDSYLITAHTGLPLELMRVSRHIFGALTPSGYLYCQRIMILWKSLKYFL